VADSKADIAEQTEILDRAISKKWNKFTWSGLLIVGVGILLIIVGLLLNTGAYSAEGLLIGIGAIIVIVGIVRILIGLINPLSPADLRNIPLPGEEQKTSNEESDVIQG